MKLDVFGHKMLGETALFLSDMVGKDTGMKSRGIVFSTLQRCASHIVSRRDITEAYDAGATAVAAALAGETGKMVIFKRISNEPYKVFTETHDIGDIANVEKTVPKEWIIPKRHLCFTRIYRLRTSCLLQANLHRLWQTVCHVI